MSCQSLCNGSHHGWTSTILQALYKWMEESGPVYLLPTGPISSFLVVSDPEVTKFVLRSTDNPKGNIYNKVRPSRHWKDLKVTNKDRTDDLFGSSRGTQHMSTRHN